MVTNKDIELWLQDGRKIQKSDIPEIEDLVLKHPYYKKGQLILAKAYHNVNDKKFDLQIQKAALCTKDREWLYHYINSDVIADILKKETITKEKETDTQPKDIKKIEDKIAEPLKETSPIKIDKAVKIEIKKGDGEILKGVEEESVNAKEPKLIVEKSKKALKKKADKKRKPVKKAKSLPKKPVVKKKKSEELSSAKKEPSSNVKTNVSTPAKLSFLDWLDSGLSSTENHGEQNTSEVPIKNKSIDKAEEMLAKFLANKPKPGEVKLNSYDPEEKSILSDSGELIPVSETLAQVYIDQKEIDLAKRVYEKLILKFPEKKAYFAALIQELNN
jgi:tetratricopeptide (TPR) repeat protein